jgi:acyl-CoA synthetase (AMP-forming)/AMP-acid ligase II
MSINSVRTLLENAAQSHGDKIAIKHDGASITYREFLRRVNQVAQYLEELDLPANARVGVYSMKSIDLMVAHHGDPVNAVCTGAFDQVIASRTSLLHH